MCWKCGERMWVAYLTERTVTTLQGVCRLTLKIHHCHNPICPRYHCVYDQKRKEDGRYHADFSGPELCPIDLTRWRTLRSEMNHRHEARRMQYRFRQSPKRYLAILEEKFIKERLPS